MEVTDLENEADERRRKSDAKTAKFPDDTTKGCMHHYS